MKYLIQNGGLASVARVDVINDNDQRVDTGTFFFMSTGAIESGDCSPIKFEALPEDVQDKVRERFNFLKDTKPCEGGHTNYQLADLELVV